MRTLQNTSKEPTCITSWRSCLSSLCLSYFHKGKHFGCILPSVQFKFVPRTVLWLKTCLEWIGKHFFAWNHTVEIALRIAFLFSVFYSENLVILGEQRTSVWKVIQLFKIYWKVINEALFKGGRSSHITKHVLVSVNGEINDKTTIPVTALLEDHLK